MKAIFDGREWKYQPRHFMAKGAILSNPVQQERIDRLPTCANAAGCTGADDPRLSRAVLGCSLNLPLARGTDDASFLAGLAWHGNKSAALVRMRTWWH
ncbi:hypothetical protein [Pseudorhodobacter sp.]|uniref:hypothetical protein n=1 Tax=Pseudorhodobacter sp. TaxID=1934400 RepID=UPI002648250E|nr:hypothetical protein [Pseudorhodobacter sp.]MDN5789216.1 hypothetical protein [Pseudorhodobacter sp.]